MASFKITGQPLFHRYWTRRLEKAQKKIKKYEDTTIDISNVLLPTPSTMIIKFTNLNKNKKFELVLQGNFSEVFKKVRESEDGIITSDFVNAEEIIRQKISEAYIINE
jgi:hypothetical protein